MNEIPTVESEVLKPISPEYDPEEYAELLALFVQRHPEPEEKPKELSDFGPEVQRLFELMEQFEVKHSLAELSEIVKLSDDLADLFRNARDLADPKRIEAAIRCYESQNPGYVETYKAKIAALRAIVLSPEETRKFDIRIAAMADETLIVDLERRIKCTGGLTEAVLAELETKRKRISNAVGFLSGNIVNHNR